MRGASKKEGGRKAMRQVQWQDDGDGRQEDILRTVMFPDLLKLCVCCSDGSIFQVLSQSTCLALLLA